MEFYEHLYTGERAAKKRYFILQSLRDKKIYLDIYVITPASGGNNLLDIYSCSEFFSPWNEKKNLLVAGIALGYAEACELAGQIVNEVYRKTGSFDVSHYLLRNMR